MRRGRGRARAVAVRGGLTFALLVTLVGWLAAAAPPAHAQECFSWDFPDPGIVRVGSRYVAYSTRSWLGQVPVMSSADGCAWDFEGDALPAVGRWAVPGADVWAPAVTAVPGGFHMYYAARHRASGRMCIGLATSNEYAGPFGDGDSQPLLCPTPSGGAIDPSVFVDADGARYLLWKNDGNCCGVGVHLWSTPIDADGRPAGPSTALLGAGGGWRWTPGGAVVEQPEMVVEGGRYVLFYSGGDWSTAGYGIGWASCAGPTGPCTDRSTAAPLLARSGRGVGTGGLSVVDGGGGAGRAVAYHAWVDGVGYANGGARGLFFDRLVVGADGTPRIGANPFGSLDSAAAVVGTGPALSVQGWTVDPDGAGPVAVHVYVDGVGAAVLIADAPRPDVAAAFGGFGAAHGFAATVPVSPGAHRVCAYAINVGYGDANPELGCRSVTVDRNPFGAFDTAVAPLAPPGGIAVSGWALDPDTASPIPVHVYVDGVGTPLLAGVERPDVAAAFPAYGSGRGFAAVVAAAPGTHRVCAYAINVGPGSANAELGCRTVVVDRNPFGAYDTAVAPLAPTGGIAVSGWALDPDTASPIPVHVYVDGVGTVLAAGVARPDVAAAFPAYGSGRGFAAVVAASPGTHRVCAYAINVGPGSANPVLGCRTVTVDRDPIGSLDSVAATGTGVAVVGWAIDPDTTQPIGVHVYVDGVGAALVADVPRPDVGSAFPAYGSRHGFSATLPAAPGPRNVCAYAIGAGPGGGNRLLRCLVA